MTLEGSVHSWDLSTGVDGPGTRFTLFLAGCTLRCVYCQNPDTWRVGMGKMTSVDDVMAQIVRYRKVFDRTGGGVTVSGGEPLLQPRFVTELFRRCAALGISTALDTSGALGALASDELLADTCLVLLDIKSMDPASYRRVTRTGSIEPTLRFASRLSEQGIPIWVRFVVVPGYNDDPDNVEALAAFVETLETVERVDVIGFHRLGVPKYEALHLPILLEATPTPTAEQLAAVRDVFVGHGQRVT
ncbi:pyruvate formate-lyase-activating protein [Acidothermaceae bacterium B102]|nr:pyruvate formate-lyase-activating protein [Acidothermaceae bacterium B102]